MRLWCFIALFLLAIRLVQAGEDSTLARDRDPYQRPRPKKHNSPSSFGATESSQPATERKMVEQGADSIVYSSKQCYHYVYNTYRYLRGARQVDQIQKASRLGLPGAMTQRELAIYDANATPRSRQIEYNARLAGIHASEVTGLALMLEGPLLWTEDFALAVIENPYGFAQFVLQVGLYMWRMFGQGFWWVKFCGFCGLMLFAYSLGSAKRAAFPLIMIVLCGLLAGQQLTLVLMIGPILIALHWWLGL